jgi:hypothetical protein
MHSHLLRRSGGIGIFGLTVCIYLFPRKPNNRPQQTHEQIIISSKLKKFSTNKQQQTMSSTTGTRTGSVRFADMAQLYTIERHEDCGNGKIDNNVDNVARHELWYTRSDFHSMRRAIAQDVLQSRAQALAGVPFNYAGDDDAAADESGVCCFGIEHLLTADIMLEVRACRVRCIHAVLAEQVRQEPSARFSCEAIALASFAQTKKVALRARMLGKLQHDSIGE